MKKEDVKRKETEVVSKHGVRDSEGNIIVPIEYDFVTKVNDNLFVATKGSVNGLRYQNGTEMYKLEYGMPYGTQFNLHLENKTLNTSLEFYTTEGKIHVGYKVLAAIVCKNDDMLLLLDENYKWSIVLIDYHNKTIFGGLYVDADLIKMDYYNNRFIISSENKFVIVEFNSDNTVANSTLLIDREPVSLFENGAIIRKNGKLGFINYTGDLILSCIYDEIIPQKTYIKAVENGGIELYTYSGKFIVGGKNYVWSQTFNLKDVDLIALGHVDGTYCLFSSDKQLLPCEYTAMEFCGEFVIVCKDDKYGLLKYDKHNDEMRPVFPETYPDKGYCKMSFLYRKDATYVTAEEYVFPKHNVYRYNLDAFRE